MMTQIQIAKDKHAVKTKRFYIQGKTHDILAQWQVGR